MKNFYFPFLQLQSQLRALRHLGHVGLQAHQAAGHPFEPRSAASAADLAHNRTAPQPRSCTAAALLVHALGCWRSLVLPSPDPQLHAAAAVAARRPLGQPGKPGGQLARQNSINDTSSSVNLSEQLTLSLGTDSEQHIFEMSGLEEEDSAIQSLSDETAASATSTSATAATATTTTPSSGLTRSNSVRARASMFQQLQEQARTPRATTG